MDSLAVELMGTAALAQGLSLVSFWKPIVALLPFVGWGFVVSSIYDKDAARWYFKRRLWNLVHLGFGAAALVVLVGFPPVLPGFLGFLAAFGISTALLAADLAIYFTLRNRDERVPEGSRWTLDLSQISEARAARKQKSRLGTVSMVFTGPGGELPAPERESPEYEIRLAAEELVKKMLDARGTHLDIFPIKGGGYGVTVLVDGVQQKLDQLPAPQATAMIDIYKRAAGLDVEDRRRRQRGELSAGQSGQSLIPFSVVAMGGSSGMRLRMTVEPTKQVTMAADELGLHDNQLRDLRDLIAGKGVVILAAPPQGGRTTTLYAMLREHDAYTSNVQTLELEPEAMIEGVRTNVFDPTEDGAEFSTTLRSILRRDPDVVGVAEVPDAETAKETVRGDLDRTRVYVSMKADDPLKAIQLYAQMVGDQKSAARSLTGVVTQRLVRRLCPNCRVAFKPAPEQLKKLGLPPDTKQIFRPSGKVLVKDKEETCPVCGGSGYFNQMGVFAVHTIDADEQGLIAKNDLTGLRASLRQKKQQSIQQAALQNVLKGDTSIEEVIRVMSPPRQAKPAAKPKPEQAAGSA
jgi:type II secretory ATPase GspE/PulE/Tfp pilus assembly ATPase PilB-like protein